MTKWLKLTLIATILSLPALGYAVTKLKANPDCPIPNCPCEHAQK